MPFILSKGKFILAKGGKFTTGGAEPVPNYLVLTAQEANSTVTLAQIGSPSLHWSFHVSYNGVDWSGYTVGTKITLSNIGDYVCFRGSYNSLADQPSTTQYHLFLMTGKIAASGNCNRLLDGIRDKTSYNCFYRLFSGCKSLTAAPALPVIELSYGCYLEMFDSCTSLKVAPALPATTLLPYCYFGMFMGCKALTTAPALPATTIDEASYASMFSGCTSLEVAPNLNATLLGEFCYNRMFNGCTSLTTAPETLPATSFAKLCYSYMFNNCSNLEIAPVILTKSGISDLSCQYMFNGCSKLKYIKLAYLGTFEPDGVTEAFYNWVSGVAATGDIYYNGADNRESVSGIPLGWTIHVDQYAYEQDNTNLKVYNSQYTQNNTEVSIY